MVILVRSKNRFIGHKEFREILTPLLVRQRALEPEIGCLAAGQRLSASSNSCLGRVCR